MYIEQQGRLTDVLHNGTVVLLQTNIMKNILANTGGKKHYHNMNKMANGGAMMLQQGVQYSRYQMVRYRFSMAAGSERGLTMLNLSKKTLSPRRM